MARVGSFAAPVDLPDHLRPWSAAGLDSLFLPGGLTEVLPAAPPPPASYPAQNAPPAPAGDYAATARAAAGSTLVHNASPTPAIDLDWPEPWRALAARLRTRPQIIITYASLMADVSGTADPARRKLFQSILGYLAWPQGTSLFWPCTDAPTLPGAAAFAGQGRNIFLNGVLSFGVTVVACFGHESEQIVGPLFPPGAGDPEVRVLALPTPEELLILLPHELHRAVAQLKTLPLP